MRAEHFLLLCLCVIFSGASLESQVISSCGVSSLGKGTIVGGKNLKRGDLPWMVPFYRYEDRKSPSYFCGGTIVSKSHILSAAHCFKSETHHFLARDIFVILGGFDLGNAFELDRTSKSPSKIILQDDWNPHTPSFDADLSVLVMGEEIQFSRFVRPVCLWDSSNDLTADEGIVAGWGESEDNVHEPLPKQLTVPIHTNEDCFLYKRALVDISSKRTFCAGSGKGNGTCFGDSGNGLFVAHEDIFYLKGIVSATLTKNSQCDLSSYSVFTNVLKFQDWIKRATTVDGSFGAPSVAPPQNVTQWGLCPQEEPKKDDNRRISQRKCDEYKKIIAEEHFIHGGKGGCSPKKVVNYKCNTSTGLIVGGTKSKPGEMPHMAGELINNNQSNKYIYLKSVAIGWENFVKAEIIDLNCGGSLISERFVLTVAQCLKSRHSPVVVRLGDQNLLNSDGGFEPRDYNIAQIFAHPQYSQRSKKNDIGLIKLDKDVEFTDFIRPACLPKSNQIIEQKALASGWGYTSYGGERSNGLMKVSLDIFSNDVCTKGFDDLNIANIADIVIDDSHICAGGLKGDADTCLGDAGGPLQIALPDIECMYHIIGLSSYGIQCGAQNTPSVFSKVSAYLDWIEPIVWTNRVV